MKHPARILFTLLMCMLAVACGNDDEPADFDITGSWTITEQSRDDGLTWETWTPVPTMMVFYPDGRFYTDGFFGEHNGRWTRNGNVVTATAADGSQIRYRFEAVSGNDALIRITTLYGSLYVKAVKQ